MIKYTALFCLLWVGLQAQAQQQTLSGILTDDQHEGIPGASLCFVKSIQTQKKRAKAQQCLSANAISDIEGNFSILLPDSIGEGPLFLRVTAAPFGRHTFAIPAFLADTFVVVTMPCDTSRKNTLDNVIISKPAVYLYPDTPTLVKVQLDFKGTLGTTYPDYGAGWEVLAHPNGDLRNLADNRTYEYLFWEGSCSFAPGHYTIKEGFVVKKEETTRFFLEKLAYIGLNNKEINDFIVYWLPVLDRNEANLVRFFINDDIDHTAVLKVTPVPENRIRIYMEYQPVAADYSLPGQSLKQYSRKGFTLVEWGGGLLENNIFLK